MELKITYGITVKNELEEIKKLLPFLIKNIREEDDIVVLWDSRDGTDEMVNYLTSLEDDISLYQDEFQGHFADWKNKLTSHCFGDYIFQIDADEIPNQILIQHLPTILQSNPGIDVVLVPRENYVTGLTDEHIKQWGWQVDKQNRINFPDLQWRIYRNSYSIKWVNKVHEKLEGFDVYTNLPLEPEFSLLHLKTIKKQEKQNNYYETL
ncbi:glycosyltransferase [bacterium]|nr:glycosyltransferase [bacterium]MDB4319763.1 glycosyltransferase [bacterium]MDB9992573.1 glycosyltransferase [bacterium]